MDHDRLLGRGDHDRRARDEGHVFHVECFVVPKAGQEPSLDQLENARRGCVELDWRLHDVVIIPVPELPVPIGQRAQRG